MNFPQKVYYNDKPIVLTTNKAAYLKDNVSAVAYSYLEGASFNNFTIALKYLDRPDIHGVIIEGASEKALFDELLSAYPMIHAGGGITYNEEGAILMIFRRGKWDLPKGKLDEGEQIEECALREVIEETGINNITLGEKITDTYHIYTQRNEQLLKRTAWYKMKGSSSEVLKPQKEENILEARWVRIEDLAPFATASYEAVREVLKMAGLNW